jgi:hypothetical protein
VNSYRQEIARRYGLASYAPSDLCAVQECAGAKCARKVLRGRLFPGLSTRDTSGVSGVSYQSGAAAVDEQDVLEELRQHAPE